MNPPARNSRGFAILLLFAVAGSVVCGLIVERFTAPGMERTFWFAVGLAAIIFPAGRYAERRGWVHGVWQAGAARRAAPAAPSSQDIGDSTAPAASDPLTPGGEAAPTTRQPGGESK